MENTCSCSTLFIDQEFMINLHNTRVFVDIVEQLKVATEIAEKLARETWEEELKSKTLETFKEKKLVGETSEEELKSETLKTSIRRN